MIGQQVWLNGRLVPREDAKVSVFDHNFIYGDGIFEGLQVVHGGVFKLTAHIERLYRSARFLEIEIPLSPEGFIGAVVETARANGLRDGYMRPIVSRGIGPTGIRNMDKLGPATVVIIAQHEDIAARRQVFEQGVKAHVASLRRIPPDCLDSRVKTCNYINNIMAYLEAKHAGADTALMLDIHGYVAEGYGSNLFAVARGTVLTPPLGNILGGITRETILEICAAERIPVDVRPMTTYDLVASDEAFETASMMEVQPIVSVDGRVVGTGSVGPMTKRLHRALRDVMESQRHSTAVFN